MPRYDKVILCLANSRKTSGRCIAGRELRAGQLGDWIRPVSARDTAELSEDDRRFANGQDPRVLDVVRITMIEPRPHGFQTENHLIDAGFYWSLEGRATWDQVLAAVDRSGRELWDNSASSYSGTHDRVAENSTVPAEGSLRFIEVVDLRISVAVEGAEFNNAKRKVRGRFTYAGVQHCLSVTDPLIERQYLAGGNGVFEVGHAFLCISLGEPYNGWAYKLIAAIVLPQA